jgi:hypothetical protein
MVFVFVLIFLVAGATLMDLDVSTFKFARGLQPLDSMIAKLSVAEPSPLIFNWYVPFCPLI